MTPPAERGRQRKTLGARGEDMAVDFLKKKGYTILHRNYRCRAGEIDIIARTKNTLCFIEVKTRQTGAFGPPQEAVTPRKQRTIARVALDFVQRHHVENWAARFWNPATVGRPGRGAEER